MRLRIAFTSMGYSGVMKLMIGFSFGVAAGMFVSSKMAERDRAQLAARTSSAVRRATDAVKDSALGEAVASNTAKVTSAASERAADAVDAVGTRTATVIQSDSNAADEMDHHAATN